MTDVATLVDAVGEDSELTPEEKETSIHFTKRDDTARMFTAEAGLARRLLAHPHADADTLNVVGTDGARTTTTVDGYEEGTIVGVIADVPVGVLSVKRDPRKTTQHAPVITESVLAEVSP